MAKRMELGERLMACAKLVRENSRLADVGTDHAYLPVWLVLEGKIPSAIAADIGEGPLQSARENVKKFGLDEKINCLLSDGLKEIQPELVDDIVIAGMGGALMLKILEQSPWTSGAGKRLILQPMSKAYDLRRYLFKNGYEIISELPAFENGKIYSAFSAEYSGENQNHSELDVYMGKLEAGFEGTRLYAEKILRRLKKESAGLKIQKKNDEFEIKLKLISDIENKFLR